MAKGMKVVVPQCEVGTCADGENPQVAIWALAQIEKTDPNGEPMEWRYVMVCDRHAEGWWDGDVLKQAQRPASYRMYESPLDPSA